MIKLPSGELHIRPLFIRASSWLVIRKRVRAPCRFAGRPSIAVRPPGRRANLIMTTPHTPFQVGKFLVSPLSRLTEAGDYLASISIRSGRGSGTHDRIFRLLPRFASDHAALKYAASEGRELAARC